jgi:hypothetical protein
MSSRFLSFGGPRAWALLAVLVAVPLAGCGSASTNLVGPTTSKCQLALSSAAKSFPSAGGNGSVTVTVDRECSWTATTDTTWLSLGSPASGQGNATLSFSVAPNPAATARSALIQVNDQRVQVAEDAAPCRFQIDPTSDSVGASGGSGSVTVSTIPGCSWSASSGADWVTLQGGGGTGSGRVGFAVASNSGAGRTATLSVAGQPFALAQASGIVAPDPAPPPAPTPPAPAPPPPMPPPPPPPAPCQYAVSPTATTLPPAGGNLTVSVTAAAGCAWTASSHVNWLTIASGNGSGNGNGSVTIAAAPNPTTNSRTGTVTVAGHTVTLTQEGLPAAQVTGTVTQVSGHCPSLTFIVGATSDVTMSASGTTVTTSGNTKFTGGQCGDVRVGAIVQASGAQQPNGSIAATDVQIQRKAKG